MGEVVNQAWFGHGRLLVRLGRDRVQVLTSVPIVSRVEFGLTGRPSIRQARPHTHRTWFVTKRRRLGGWTGPYLVPTVTSVRFGEREAGVSRPPAPREPEHSFARNRLSHRLAVRAGAPSGTGVRANGGANYGVG